MNVIIFYLLCMIDRNLFNNLLYYIYIAISIYLFV